MKSFREWLKEGENKEVVNESGNTNLLRAIIPIIDNIISKYGKMQKDESYKFETFRVVWNEDDENYEYYDGNKLAFNASFTNNDNTVVENFSVVDELAMCDMLFITLKGKYKI